MRWSLTGLLVLAAPSSADARLERRLALPPGGTFTLAAKVGGVTLIGDSPAGAVVHPDIRGDLNGGGVLLRLRSSGGGVRIARAAGATAAR